MACAPVEGVCIGRKSTKQESFTGGEDQQNCKMVDHVLPGHQMWASVKLLVNYLRAGQQAARVTQQIMKISIVTEKKLNLLPPSLLS